MTGRISRRTDFRQLFQHLIEPIFVVVRPEFMGGFLEFLGLSFLDSTNLVSPYSCIRPRLTLASRRVKRGLS